MASDCSSPSRFSQPDVDDQDGPDHGDVLLRRIADYGVEARTALNRTLTDKDFKLATYLITELYPQWYRNLEEIQQYRMGAHGGGQSWNRHPDKLFDFAVSSMVCMPQALSRAKGIRQEDKRAFMPVLLQTLDRLSRAPWIRYRGQDHLLRHLDDMAGYRRRYFPLNQAAFCRGELAGNAAFDELFAAFDRLAADGPPQTADQGRALVHGSVTLTLDAARALLVRLDDVNLPLAALLDPATRPTCVDRPVTDPLFFSGTPQRPGAVALKAYLGSPPRDEADSRFPLDGSGAYLLGQKREAEAPAAGKTAADAGGINNNNNSSSSSHVSKKQKTAGSGPVQEQNGQSSRPAGNIGGNSTRPTGNTNSNSANQQNGPSSQPVGKQGGKASGSRRARPKQLKKSKRPSRKRPAVQEEDDWYPYTLTDADADIVRIESWVQGTQTAGLKPTVHPVCPMYPDVLARYYDTLQPAFDEYRWARSSRTADDGYGAADDDGHSDASSDADGPPDPARAQAQLAELARDMAAKRAYLTGMLAADRYNYNKLKAMKCASLLLLYLRSLWMRLHLRAHPRGDGLRARADRLADWILHEEVWHDATLYSLRVLAPHSPKRPQLRRDRAAREANLAAWRADLDELEGSIYMKATEGPVEEEEEEEEEGGEEEEEEEMGSEDVETSSSVESVEEEVVAAAEQEPAAAPAAEGKTGQATSAEEEDGRKYAPVAEMVEALAAMTPAHEAAAAQAPGAASSRHEAQEVEDLEDRAYPDEPALVLDPARYARRMRRPYAQAGPSRYEWHRVAQADGTHTLVKGARKKPPPPPKPARFAVFAAGGPEGFGLLPREGVYDRLQYMIILTFWRVLQAQLHGL